MSASQQNRGKETIGRWYRRYFGISGLKKCWILCATTRETSPSEDGIGNTLESVAGLSKVPVEWGLSSSFDDKHCFVVDQRFVAVLSKMVILLHCAIQQCVADFPSRTSVVLA